MCLNPTPIWDGYRRGREGRKAPRSGNRDIAEIGRQISPLICTDTTDKKSHSRRRLCYVRRQGQEARLRYVRQIDQTILGQQKDYSILTIVALIFGNFSNTSGSCPGTMRRGEAA